jgi:hypothetical protein
MNRRKAFKLIGFSIFGISFGGALYIYGKSFDEVVKDIILTSTDGLEINKSDIDLFIKDASNEKFWNYFGKHKKTFIKYHAMIDDKLPLPYKNKYKSYSSKIVMQFLLSTDYFVNKMNIRKVSYIQFHNPYKVSCGNPFTNMYY